MIEDVISKVRGGTIRAVHVRRTVHITFQRAGQHCYPYAPDDVSYLRAMHRHLFKFKVSVDVAHNERDIEFHQLLKWCDSRYGQELSADSKSCETLADELATLIRNSFPYPCDPKDLGEGLPVRYRNVSVEVWEDGECGATVTLSDG